MASSNKYHTWNESMHRFMNSSNLSNKLEAAKQIYTIASKGNNFISMLCKHENRQFLRNLWEYIQPDNVQRRQDLDESGVLLELHLVSLKILCLVNCSRNALLINTSIVTIENVYSIFDLLRLDSHETHKNCCHKALKDSWKQTAVDHAQTLLLGHVFEAVMELSGTVAAHGQQLYNVKLQTCDNGDNVADTLAQHPDISTNNLCRDLASDSLITELVKVVHVVSPQYIWVQDHSDEIKELAQDMAEYVKVAKSASEEDSAKQVVVKLKKFIFRADIVSWTETAALVFAIDYGWIIEAPHSVIYQTEEYISELPALAKFCKVINILPPSTNSEIRKYSVKLLQSFVSSEPFAAAILNNFRPDVIHIVEVLQTTRNGSLAYEILLFFSQLCLYKRHRVICGQLILRPVVGFLKKWFLCPEVVRMGFECLRNLVTLNPTNKEQFIFCGGLELAFKAYATYSNDTDDLFLHCLHILKYCLKDYQFQTDDLEANDKDDSGLSEVTDTGSTMFCHLGNMSQYNVLPCDEASFLDNITKPKELALFARELVSHLNSDGAGGTVYIGVNYQGVISGIQMNRSRKDDFRTKIDMVLTKLVCDYRQIELPNQLFECSFEEIKNTHNRALPEDVKMYLIKVTVEPSNVLARVEGAEVDIFWKRRNCRAVPLTANEVRQCIADAMTEGPASRQLFTDDYLPSRQPIADNLVVELRRPNKVPVKEGPCARQPIPEPLVETPSYSTNNIALVETPSYSTKNIADIILTTDSRQDTADVVRNMPSSAPPPLLVPIEEKRSCVGRGRGLLAWADAQLSLGRGF